MDPFNRFSTFRSDRSRLLFLLFLNCTYSYPLYLMEVLVLSAVSCSGFHYVTRGVLLSFVRIPALLSLAFLSWGMCSWLPVEGRWPGRPGCLSPPAVLVTAKPVLTWRNGELAVLLKTGLQLLLLWGLGGRGHNLPFTDSQFSR